MKSLLLCSLLSLGIASSAQAQVIDVNQPSVNAVMAAFYQTDLAQSFQPTMDNCSGAGVELTAGWGYGGTFTAALWSGLPNAGGTMLASGSASATPGTWVDVYWPAVPVTPGTTYYMVYSCTDGNMAIAGDTTNPYSGGYVYANAGYGPFPGFDYTFRTWADGGISLTATGSPGTYMTFDIAGATPGGAVAYLYAYGLGSHAVFNPLAGAYLTTGLSNVGFTNAGIFFASAAGTFSLSSFVPVGAAGNIHVQAVDATSNTVSNVIGL